MRASSLESSEACNSARALAYLFLEMIPKSWEEIELKQKTNKVAALQKEKKMSGALENETRPACGERWHLSLAHSGDESFDLL